MTASNHAVTGAVIAMAVHQPLLALPLAVVSHFALDAAPHFGNHPKMAQSSRAFLFMLAVDAGIASSILLTLVVLMPGYWLLPVAGALLSMAPDLMWFPNFLRVTGGRKLKKPDAITRWHKSIQRYERPWGIYVEAIWFSVMLPVMFALMVRL